MTTRTHTSRKGFTLIELLTVIAIIGILASILIPTIGNVILTAKKAAAQSNAGQIAKTYIAYSNSGSNTRTIGTPDMAGGNANKNNGSAATIEDVAYILAKSSGLNDANVWFIKADEQLAGFTLPRSVIVGELSTATDVAPDFAKIKPKSWAFVTGLPSSAPGTTTPLLWTYGLGKDGVWSKTSPWVGTGGHVAYLDGHVEWADKISTEPNGVSFIGYQSGAKAGLPTVNYMEAISKNAKPVNETGQ